MQIILNGEPIQTPDNLTAAGLIEHLKLENERLAMEINQEIAPRSRYQDIRIQPDDKVEIVRAIGGG
jgi:sulfur carrier protein